MVIETGQRSSLTTDLLHQVAGFALTGETSLYVLLPASNTPADFQQVEERLTDAALLRLTETMSAAAPQEAEVLLPKLQLDVEPDMLVLMKKLGLLRSRCLHRMADGGSFTTLSPLLRAGGALPGRQPVWSLL